MSSDQTSEPRDHVLSVDCLDGSTHVRITATEAAMLRSLAPRVKRAAGRGLGRPVIAISGPGEAWAVDEADAQEAEAAEHERRMEDARARVRQALAEALESEQEAGA